MARADEIFDYLRGRPAGCATCGCVLLTIAGADLRIQVCPRCDETPGTRPAEIVPHAKLHYSLQPGCPECIEARRARL